MLTTTQANTIREKVFGRLRITGRIRIGANTNVTQIISPAEQGCHCAIQTSFHGLDPPHQDLAQGAINGDHVTTAQNLLVAANHNILLRINTHI